MFALFGVKISDKGARAVGDKGLLEHSVDSANPTARHKFGEEKRMPSGSSPRP